MSGFLVPPVVVPPPGTSNYGYLNVPLSPATGGFPYTLALSDAGLLIYYTAGIAGVLTIPANAAIAFPVGTGIIIVNDASAAVNLTIQITTDTLILSPAGTAGARTLAQFGKAGLLKVAATRWYINGTGLT